MTIVRAQKRSPQSAVEFVPCSVNRDGTNTIQPLAYEGDYVRFYPTFEAAQAICHEYEHGTDGFDGIESARWDYQAGEWTDIECRPRHRGHRGEDFHADC